MTPFRTIGVVKLVKLSFSLKIYFIGINALKTIWFYNRTGNCNIRFGELIYLTVVCLVRN